MSGIPNVPDVPQVRELLASIVEEKGPDYVYERLADEDATGDCFYVNHQDGTPSCIAGHLIMKLGVPASAFLAYEGTSADVVWDVLVAGSKDVAIGVHTPPEQYTPIARALKQAQRVQDDGGSWGNALRVFDETLGAIQ